MLAPTALSIAGLDPSGGAGLAADLRSFGAAGVWGAAVCAALTVQSTQGVRAVRAVPSALVIEQAREVLADARVRAVKTGALGSAANVRAVLALLAEHPAIPWVVDPVMLPSRRAGAGAAGLHGRGVGPLRALAAAATLVTPNLAEAAALLGSPVPDAEAPAAARGAGRGRRAGRAGQGRSRPRRRGGRLARAPRAAAWSASRARVARDPAGPRRRLHAGVAHRRAPRGAEPTRRSRGPTIWSRPRAGPAPGSIAPWRRRSRWAPGSA